MATKKGNTGEKIVIAGAIALALYGIYRYNQEKAPKRVGSVKLGQVNVVKRPAGLNIALRNKLKSIQNGN